MSVVKVYYKIERSPWALTLTEPNPEAFELPASDWQGKKILANQQRGAAGDCGVFLHDIGFLIDHHCCVVHLTGEVSGGKFQKKTVNKAGKVCKGGGAGNVCKGVESGSHASRISNKNLRYVRQIHLKIHRRLLFLVAVLKLAFFPAS